MKKEKISQAVSQMDSRFILEALEEKISHPKEKNWAVRFWKFHRFATCACFIFLIVIFSFTTVFAANEAFRQTVISIFYPLYSDYEIQELDDGHRTSSFDEADLLLTFLSRFNAEEMEPGILAKYMDGYYYTFVKNNRIPENSLDSILAVVESTRANYRLLITIEKKPYKETTGVWQIVSYQIVTAKKAEEILSEMPKHIPED